MSRNVKGYLYGVLAASFYGMNPLFALPLYGEGMSANSVLFFRYLLALPFLAILAMARGQNLAIEKKHLFGVIGLGLLMAFSSLGLFLSYEYMDAGIASSLLFVYPLMVALIMAFFCKERIGIKTIICLCAATIGIFLLYNGNGGGKLSGIGVFWVMMSALSYAVYLVCVNLKGISSIPTVVLTFYVILFGIVLFAARIPFGCKLEFPVDFLGWACVVLLATLPTALSLLLTTLAIQHIGSTPTAILGVFEPVTALIAGVVVFGEILTTTDVFGLLLIFIAVSIVVGGGSIHVPINRIRKLFPRRKR